MAMVKSGWLHRQSEYILYLCYCKFTDQPIKRMVDVKQLDFSTRLHFRYHTTALEEKLVRLMGWRATRVLQWSAAAWHGGWHSHESPLHQHPQLCSMSRCLSRLCVYSTLNELHSCFKSFFKLIFSPYCSFLVRVEPTRGKATWRIVPDRVQRWTGHQFVCRQCRWCPVRQLTHTLNLYCDYFSSVFLLSKLNFLCLC